MMTNEKDDFDPEQAIRNLSANLEQPDRFAQIFCEAAKKQKAIDEVLRENIKFLIKNDIETQNLVKILIKEIEKESWRSLLKKGSLIIGSIVMLILGAILQTLSRKFLG